MPDDFKNEFPQIIKNFANYKDVIQGCSAKTVTEYLFDLRTFCRFLIASREDLPRSGDEFNSIDIRGLDVKFFESVTSSEIYDFLAFVGRERENAARARARKLSAIKQFYKYCTVKQMLFENNPAINIESPKVGQSLPKYLSLDESIDLLSSVAANVESKTRERDYCILTIFLNCGVRLSELVGINLTDIDKELRSMRVIGKGNKERIVYLNDACRAALQLYIPVRMKTPAKEKGESALFLSGQGHRISVKTVQWMVKKYLGEAGLEFKNYSTHKLRHTAATLMYQSGEVDIRVLKDILGHAQLNTTQIYTHVSNEHMEEAMEKNPLSGIKPKRPPKAEPLEAAEDDE